MKHALSVLLVIVFAATCSVAQTKQDIYVSTNTFRDLDFNKSFLTTINFGTSFYPHDHFSIGPEVGVYKFWNPDYSTIGISAGPVIRMYMYKQVRFAIYSELKGAVVFMFPEYRFQSRNFVFVSNVGSEFPLSPNAMLRASLGYHHFSNARHYDYNYNSASDAIGGSVGVAFRLR